MRADQHKCLPHLACINPTLLYIEYLLVFGQLFENEFETSFPLFSIYNTLHFDQYTRLVIRLNNFQFSAKNSKF